MAIDPDARQKQTASDIIGRLRRMSLDHQLAVNALDQELVRIELERLIYTSTDSPREGVSPDEQTVTMTHVPNHGVDVIPTSSLTSLRDEMRKEAAESRDSIAEAEQRPDLTAATRFRAEADVLTDWADKLDTLLAHKGEQP